VIRQRVKLRTPFLAYVVRALTLLLGLALLWYGLMTVLLAVKVSAHTVNSLSAYRTLFHAAANLKPHDFSTAVRLIAGFGGFLVFLVFLYLAFQELPRPYLARAEMALGEDQRGATVVQPRAIERVAEIAAQGNPNVTVAAGRLGDRELNVAVDMRRATVVADTLMDVRTRVSTELDRLALPDLPVNVTLTHFDRQTRRELS
jgi:hypothetical protein